MKLTDLALIFVVILLPVVIIVYVNTSFVTRAAREEMYYKNLVNSAVSDATQAMKNVENQDNKIDYGYSGIVDNKVSVNADIAVDTFFTSMYNNMGIKGNKGSEMSFKSYIPALAIIDYDGIYIYSAEDVDGYTEYVLKPKKYFTYTYYISQSYINGSLEYDMVEYTEETDISQAMAGLIYQVTFTQDDFVYLKVFKRDKERNIKEISKIDQEYINAFYLNDDVNNDWLVGTQSYINNNGGSILSSKQAQLKSQIAQKLLDIRKDIIAKICMEELAFAVNNHNFYARKAGIKYDFRFSINSDEDWYDTVDGIGMVAVVQGISLGNRYLNYSAYSMTDLTSSHRYYLSDKLIRLKASEENTELSKYEEVLSKYKYYHNSENCPLYKAYIEYIDILKQDKISPSFLYDKKEAAANGFRSCFICKP